MKISQLSAKAAQCLREWVGSTTYQRGHELWLRGQVQGFDTALAHGTWVMSGLVQGSQMQPYEVGVTVALSPSGGLLRWEGDCSCPVERNCKHAVALTLEAAGGEAVPDSPPATVQAPPTAEPTAEPTAASAALPVVAPSASTANPQASLPMLSPAPVPAPQPDPQHPDDLALRYWITQQQSALRPAGAPASAMGGPPQQLVVLLSARDAGPRGLRTGPRPTEFHALCALSRRKVQGKGWNKPTTALKNWSNWSALERLTPPEQDLIALARGLMNHRNDYGDSLGGPVAGRAGLQLVRDAAERGVLFFGETSTRPMEKNLSWGPAMEARLQWALHGGGWCLSLDLPMAQGVLSWVEAGPVLYIDTQHSRCGEVLLPEGVTVVELRRWVFAPAVSEAQWARHAPALTPLLGRLPAPPVLGDVRRVLGVKPEWRLTIDRDPTVAWPQQGWLYMHLSFAYSGIELPFEDYAPNPSPNALMETVRHRGQTCVVQRDLMQELTARYHLVSLAMPPNALGLASVPAGVGDWLDQLAAGFPALRELGFSVQIAPDLADWLQTADQSAQALQAQFHSAPGVGEYDAQRLPWFDLSLGIEVGGQRHNLLPWVPMLFKQWQRSPEPGYYVVPLPETPEDASPGLLRIPAATLRPWLDALVDLFDDKAQGGESLRLSRAEALRTVAALGAQAAWDGAASLRKALEGLRQTGGMPEVPLPHNVHATLRPYQQQGLNWLQFLREHELAGILADDMGLGKTLQTLAHIQVEKNAGRLDCPALVIAPVSLMTNWQREAERFCPELRVVVFHGAQRHEQADHLAAHDLVIAPYSLLQRERERWLAQCWHLLVLDEAQNIKNASTQAAQVVTAMQARHRLCLSGTPMENHLGELWSLFNFLMPGFLGSSLRFGKLFRTPIERRGDAQALAQLQARTTPFILRRTKRMVAAELPPKTETLMPVQLEGAQANLYETIRLAMERQVRAALQSKGLARSQIAILDALLKLRQVCCDPRLLKLEAASKVKTSAKLDQLMSLLPEMIEEGRRVLLFSQFTSMLSLIEAELPKHGIRWVKLTGQTRDRTAAIDAFTRGEVPLFLISLKAGGVGLNLTAADTVIHFDPWWNPAAEQQATDRAHRIGQDKNVWVIKLVAQGTLEERIVQLQERKAALAGSIYGGAEARRQPLFTESDLAELLKPLGAR